jgi:hypothetical protein
MEHHTVLAVSDLSRERSDLLQQMFRDPDRGGDAGRVFFRCCHFY